MGGPAKGSESTSEKDKVVRSSTYFDTATMLAQLGVMPGIWTALRIARKTPAAQCDDLLRVRLGDRAGALTHAQHEHVV